MAIASISTRAPPTTRAPTCTRVVAGNPDGGDIGDIGQVEAQPQDVTRPGPGRGQGRRDVHEDPPGLRQGVVGRDEPPRFVEGQLTGDGDEATGPDHGMAVSVGRRQAGRSYEVFDHES
jgi:hypothetical protein